ncbi:MAG TPA: hypothetical protein VLR27_05930 [Acidimicrobiales bacterium]|nr:hypothetical protein [Acidimicrobiales bacterium]
MPPAGAVTVEPVESKSQLRRFAEVPFVLLGTDDRWSAGVRAHQQWRHDARRHPYFDRGDAAFFLARRGGQPAGRIAAHVDGTRSEQGWFGMFDVADDDAVTAALVDAATGWLREQAVTSMTGPVTWTPDEDFGVLVEGYEHPATTGRAWHPPWYAEQLRSAGASPGERRATFHLSTEDWAGEVPTPSGEDPPPQAGGYADPALVLDGIAAVPDVTRLLAGASVRSAWRLARRARERASDIAVCVRCDGDPSVLVPRLLTACRARGYSTLLSPWTPDGGTPDRVHQVFRFTV